MELWHFKVGSAAGFIQFLSSESVCNITADRTLSDCLHKELTVPRSWSSFSKGHFYFSAQQQSQQTLWWSHFSRPTCCSRSLPGPELRWGIWCSDVRAARRRISTRVPRWAQVARRWWGSRAAAAARCAPGWRGSPAGSTPRGAPPASGVTPTWTQTSLCRSSSRAPGGAGRDWSWTSPQVWTGSQQMVRAKQTLLQFYD